MSTRRWHRPNGDGIVRFDTFVLDYFGVSQHVEGFLSYTLLQGAIDGGTWTVQFGADIATFAYNDDTSTIAAGLNALPSVASAGGVTLIPGWYWISGINPLVTFNSNGVRPPFIIDTSGLTDNGSPAPVISLLNDVQDGTISLPSIQQFMISEKQAVLMLKNIPGGITYFHWALSTTNTPAPYGPLVSNPGGIIASGSPYNEYLPCYSASSIGGAIHIFPTTPNKYVPSATYYLFYGCWDDGGGLGTDAATPLKVSWNQTTGLWAVVP